MTNLNEGTVATDIDDNTRLSAEGYTIRHIETWHDQDQTCIIWEAPDLTDADLPY